jgi:copper(I)-binding protein
VTVTLTATRVTGSPSVAGTSLEVDAVNRRAPRAAALGVLLLSPLALAACSAGQVTQTATQEQNLGNNAGIGDLLLRGLSLPYPTGGVYRSGDDARLLAAVASTSDSDDTLVSIEGEDFDSVEVVDPSASAAPAAGSSTLDLTVPAQGVLYLGTGDGPSVTLVGLADELTVGQYIDVTFTFEQAGEVTVPVPVGTSSRDLPRGEPFDFEHSEEGTEIGSGSVEEEAEGGS